MWFYLTKTKKVVEVNDAPAMIHTMIIMPGAPTSHRSEGHEEGLYQKLHFYNNKSMLFYFISYLGALGQRPARNCTFINIFWGAPTFTIFKKY